MRDTKDLIQRLREFEISDDLGNGDFSVCERAADRIRELESINAEWQPIETAPKDGTVVDLWIVAKDCEFRAPDFKFCNERWEGEHSETSLDWTYMNVGMQPTHWRDRPEQPR